MSDGLKLISNIIGAGTAQTLREIDRNWFLDEELAAYDWLSSHYRRFGQLPSAATLEGDTGIELPSAPESLDYYLTKVRDRKTYNDLREPFRDLRVALADNSVDNARTAIDNLKAVTRVMSSGQDLRNISEVGRAVIRGSIAQWGREGMPGITTGWPCLDNQLDGYQPGDLVTWVARPGMGKTYYLLHQAIAAWNAGSCVLFVSMEMTLEQLGRRLYGMVSGVNPRAIRRGRVSRYGTNRLNQTLEGFSENGHRFHMYAGNFRKNVEDIETLVQELHPDIIYIDGVYILRTATGYKAGRFDIAAEVFDYLKQMTIVHDRPIICTTKFNRSAGKKGTDGSLESIGMTDAVGSNSSIVFALKEGDAPNEDTQRIVEVMKGREGEEGTYMLNFSFSPMDFSEAIGGYTPEPAPEGQDDPEGAVAMVTEDDDVNFGVGGSADWGTGG